MKKDISQTAKSIVDIATGEAEKPKKDPAAQALGSRGGKARAKNLSDAEKSAIGKKAAAARWKKD